MRNLRNVHRSLVESPQGLRLTACAWDVEANTAICAFGPTQDDSLLQLKRWTNATEIPDAGSTADDALENIASWDALCPIPELDYDEILNLHYFSDTSTICLVLLGGDIVVIREDPQFGEEKIEIVGSVDGGISAAAWSPDDELLTITTKLKTLLYMTRDFENVTNITLSSDDLRASKHVSVGWGKKETQFKGKKARLLRDPTMPETVDEGILNELDRGNTTISWRGDGAFVAVNSIESGPRRVIRVYSREGVLDSASEPVDGLAGALSWRPAGNLLAGIQRLKDRIDVVFFERNGLRHGQFTLRLAEDELLGCATDISLKWNMDSSVLAVCFKDRIQLWTMGNYHYYLKQELFLLASNSREIAVSLIWHTEKPLRFLLGSEDGIQMLEYNIVVGAGPTSPPNDYGIVAVIDGKNLKITPLRLANIPPPMAFQELTLSSNIVDVAVDVIRTDHPIVFIGVLHHEGICLYQWDLNSKPPSSPSLTWFASLSSDRCPRSMQQQLAFTGENSLSVLASTLDGSICYMLDKISGFVDKRKVFTRERFQGLVGQVTNAQPDTCLLLKGASVISPNTWDCHIDCFGVVQTLGLLPNSSPRVEVVGIRNVPPQLNRPFSQNEDQLTGNLVMFGLSENGILFANDRVLARNCTSFLVTTAHLIFTTGQHLLKFVHLVGVADLEVPPDTPELDERCRSIERGAKLVTVMPSIFALVMQMPRGNLETIYPRALVLAGIRQSINEKRYKKAFLACRSQRVDMNILHDHDPSNFIANIGLFVSQIEKVEHIDLFLSQLREEDVSKLMYKETLGANASEEIGANSKNILLPLHRVSKVNSICNAFIEVLHNRSPIRFQNVITAHVCKVPPDLDAGLEQIARIRKENPEQVDRTVEHICFLADVNRLYDNALGLYDLELTLLVAQQSQKDPREYLPFLQNLQTMPLLRRQFSIDNHLGRFGKALRQLHDLKAFEEVKTYVLRHELYVQALELYHYQGDQLVEIMRLYANHLQQSSKFREAGIAYEYLLDYVSASESYRLAHLWKESLACANLIPLPQSQLHSLANTLADSLIESKDYLSAATIYLDHLSDISSAARLFCKGYFFADALRIVSIRQRTDLLESVIDAGLLDGMASMTELLADCKSQLQAQVPRIRELRAKQAADPLAFFDGDINGGADIPDNVSLAPTDASTTGGSLFTRYTNRTGTVATSATRQTSKNRRREERKRARGKKGSVYEEEYLINSVGRLVERVNAVVDEVNRLVTGLMRRGMRERAAAVESAMVDLLELCRTCVPEVFPSETKEARSAAVEGAEGMERPRGGDGVLWDSLEGEKRDAPVLKGFETLSLLAR